VIDVVEDQIWPVGGATCGDRYPPTQNQRVRLNASVISRGLIVVEFEVAVPHLRPAGW
jgi:hypothetical protein